MASEVKSYLGFEISDLNYPHIHVTLLIPVFIFEAITASKWPGRSNLTSDLKSVTPITYLSMCILLIWYGPLWQPLRPPQPPNSLGGQIWPQIWNQWPQLPTYPCAYCLYGMGPFDSLRGHHSPQTASEVKSDLRFGICGPNFICNHVCLGCWGLFDQITEEERRIGLY